MSLVFVCFFNFSVMFYYIVIKQVDIPVHTCDIGVPHLYKALCLDQFRPIFFGLFEFLFEFQNRIFLEFFVRVSSCSRPVKVGGRTTYRTLSPKTTPLQIGFNCWSHLWEVSRRLWLKYTHLMWLWGGCLHKILSLGAILCGTKWLLWCPHRQSPTFLLMCEINQGLIKRGSTIDH
jgi:hypothetical protein